MSFNEILQDFDVESYIGQHGRVRKSSRSNVSLTPCPLCGDARRDKFYINVAGAEGNGRWNSYCCHGAGGLVELVMALEDMVRDEAVAFIKAEVLDDDAMKFVPLVEITEVESAQKNTEVEPAIEFPSPLAQATPDTPMTYRGRALTLAHRGIDPYLIERHRLMVTGGFTAYEGRVRPYLANRLIIPIASPDGKSWLSWQGRDLTGAAERKYVFPWGDKSASTFYGWHEAADLKTLVIVEGAPNKWAFDRLGRDLADARVERMAIASFGKKLSKDQEELLIAHPAKRVVIAWDLDAAPEIGKVCSRLAGRKEVLIMPPPPAGLDYDELPAGDLLRLFVAAEPYSLPLIVRMKASLSLSGK